LQVMKRILSHAFKALHDQEGTGESVICRQLASSQPIPRAIHGSWRLLQPA
jgi:hypothetical protein